MVSILKIFDIYSYKFNFLYKGQLSYKTNAGGCISLITFLVFLFAFGYFAQSFISRLNPTIFMKSLLSDESFNTKIDDVKMLLGFSIDGLDPSDILNNTYFNSRAYIKKQISDDSDDSENPNTITFKKEIQLKNCSDVRGDSRISKKKSCLLF